MIFECNFYHADWLPVELNYSCYATIIPTGDNEFLTNVTGNHLDGRTNEDVEFLDTWYQFLLDRIPRGIATFFPNLKGIEWFTAGLKTIEAQDLEPFTNLQLLSIPNNAIISLDGDLFKHNSKLQWLSLHGNQLQRVGHNLFAGLHDLTFANFLHNPCIHIVAETSEDVKNLNDKLPVSCPPLETPTTPDDAECPVECSRQIDLIENEINELRINVTKLTTENVWRDNKIRESNKNILELQKELSEHKLRLYKLERLVAELNSKQ